MTRVLIVLMCSLFVIGGCDGEDGGPDGDAGDAGRDTVDDTSGDADATADVSDDTAPDTGDDGGRDADGQDGALEFAFDFADGAVGWSAGVADYSPTQSDTIAFRSGIEPLPSEVAENDQTGYLLSGKNVSDDLAMFLKRRLGPADGIQANQSYEVSYRIVFASNAPSNCVGVGGAPGESVYLKAGAAGVEPMAVEQDGDIRMNVDKGNQSSGGPNASVVGHIANGIPCEEAIDRDYPYVSLERQHTHTQIIQADSQGRLWLLVLTDSGFEATTALYYQHIDVTLEAVSE